MASGSVVRLYNDVSAPIAAAFGSARNSGQSAKSLPPSNPRLWHSASQSAAIVIETPYQCPRCSSRVCFHQATSRRYSPARCNVSKGFVAPFSGPSTPTAVTDLDPSSSSKTRSPPPRFSSSVRSHNPPSSLSPHHVSPCSRPLSSSAPESSQLSFRLIQFFPTRIWMALSPAKQLPKSPQVTARALVLR